MTIYEELGVPKDASEEEIQQSLRTLSKMLHPDLHEEAATRRLAKAQMKRLKKLVSKLGDPNQRYGYDASLGSSEIIAEEEISQGWLWLACLVLTLGLGFCLYEMAPDPAFLARSLAESPNVDEQGPLLLSSPNRVDSIANLKRDLKPLQQHLEGIWFYGMNATSRPARWAYSANYVELKIEERKGQLVGAFRSRYQIPNKASHQELIFRFRGPSRESEFGWAVGKMKGRIHLELEAEGVIQVRWRIENDQNFSGLDAGSATLVRRKT